MWLTDLKSKHFDKLGFEMRNAKRRTEARFNYLLAVIPHAIGSTPAHVRDKKDEWMYQFVVGD